MALDEPSDNDETLDLNGFTFVVEKGLLATAKRIFIDISYMGFQVTSEGNMGFSEGSSCSTCGSGSCSTN